MTGPRPLQQLLGVIESNDQWKQNQEKLRLDAEALKVQQANADTSRRSNQGELIRTFMTLSPNADPADRAHLAGLIGQAAGVDPASLMGAVGNRPVSAATIGDLTAKAQYETTKNFMPRLTAAIDSISDENVKQIARGHLAKTFTGLDPGTLRESTTMADPNAVSGPDMEKAVMQKLGLLISPAEQKRFAQVDEQIKQGWAGMADDNVYKAATLALNRSELMFRQNQMMEEANARAEGRKAENMMSPMGSPKEIAEQLVKMQQQTSGPSMTPEARNAMAVTQNAYAREFTRMMQGVMPPDVLEEFLKQFAPGLVQKQNSSRPMIMR